MGIKEENEDEEERRQRVEGGGGGGGGEEERQRSEARRGRSRRRKRKKVERREGNAEKAEVKRVWTTCTADAEEPASSGGDQPGLTTVPVVETGPSLPQRLCVTTVPLPHTTRPHDWFILEPLSCVPFNAN